MDRPIPQVWAEPECAVSSIFMAAQDCCEASQAAFIGSRESYSFALSTLMLSCAAVEAFLNAWCRRHIKDQSSDVQSLLLKQLESRSFSIYQKLTEWPRAVLGAELPERADAYPPFLEFVRAYELRAELMHFRRQPETITSGNFTFDHMVNITTLKVSPQQAKEILDSAYKTVSELLRIEFSKPGYPEDFKSTFNAWTRQS